MIFGLVAVLNTDVVARGVFHSPLNGSIELVIFSMVLIVFLQLPDVVQSNRLTRSDGFLAMIKDNHPDIASYTSRSIDFGSAIFMGLIAWTMWPEFHEAIESCYFFIQPDFGPPPSGNIIKDLSTAFGRCDYFGTPGIFTAPTWPLKLATVFGVSLCSIIFMIKALLGKRELELVHMESNTNKQQDETTT
jgi:TRAP-type C4-dicarboxylate transport system permease small subunit